MLDPLLKMTAASSKSRATDCFQTFNYNPSGKCDGLLCVGSYLVCSRHFGLNSLKLNRILGLRVLKKGQ